jgi:hypothetical protein
MFTIATLFFLYIYFDAKRNSLITNEYIKIIGKLKKPLSQDSVSTETALKPSGTGMAGPEWVTICVCGPLSIFKSSEVIEYAGKNKGNCGPCQGTS